MAERLAVGQDRSPDTGLLLRRIKLLLKRCHYIIYLLMMNANSSSLALKVPITLARREIDLEEGIGLRLLKLILALEA